MLRLAKNIARLLELGPDTEVALSLESTALADNLRSFVSASGAHLADEGAVTASAVIELPSLPAPLVPARARDTIARVLPGGRVVLAITGASGPHLNAQTAAQKFGPCFDLEHVHAEVDPDGALVMRGVRRKQPTRERIKELRGLAHDMEASILVGMDGLSEGLVASAREALARHGLVKAKLTPRARLDKDDAAVELAWAAGGQLVQRVGKTAVIYRPDVPLAPPGKR